MIEKRICFKCENVITKNQHHFVFNEFINEEPVNTNYAHKKCWDEVKSTLNINKEANVMLKGMKTWLVKSKIIPEEQITVDIIK